MTSPGRIESRSIHEGRVVRLYLDRVRFPDGSEGELEIVRHPGAAAVLPIVGPVDDPDPAVLLIRQYRYAAGGVIYEVPAGVLDSDEETPEECARRELEEETGHRAERIVHLTSVFTTPGFTDEVIHLYAASGLEPTETSHERDEFIEVVRVPLSEALRLVRDRELVDAKSIVTLLYADRWLRARRSTSGDITSR